MSPDVGLARLVNPLIGTAEQGHTFPGASWPFGMVQPSPETPHAGPGGGYDVSDDHITGFSTMHLSGPGCPAFGHVTILPCGGRPDAPGLVAVPFSHADEDASAGRYDVTLTDLADVEVTAGPRTAWYRITHHDGPRGLLLSLSRGQTPTTDARLERVDEHTLLVRQTNSAFGSAQGDPSITVHAVVRCSRPVALLSPWLDEAWLDEAWLDGAPAVEGTEVGVHLLFDADLTSHDADLHDPEASDVDGDDPLVVTITTSFVDAHGALVNEATEWQRLDIEAQAPSSDDFERARDAAEQAWQTELARVSIEGASDEQLVIHHTALYHALLQPTLASDADGRYLGADRRVHQVTGRDQYGNFSLWDSFRTQQPLLALLCPRRSRDIALSLLETTKQLGQVPRWVLAGVETNVMSGDAGTVSLAQYLATGALTNDEIREVYPLLVDNARRPAPADAPGWGRHGIAFYREHGYVAYEREHAHSCGSASVGLEWAAADAALARVARRLGEDADADDFEAQSLRYPSGWDETTGFFRPRLADGSWLEPFDPAHTTAHWIDSMGFEEGSAWQYWAGITHDVDGWLELVGGREAALAKLDQLFAIDQVTADPTSARTLYRQGAHFAAWNEHDMHVPWLYTVLGRPERTAQVLQVVIEQFYFDRPDGLPDNDDLGTLSAWYLLACWGLYQFVPGSGEWLRHQPYFSRVVLHPDDGSQPIVRAQQDR